MVMGRTSKKLPICSVNSQGGAGRPARPAPSTGSDESTASTFFLGLARRWISEVKSYSTKRSRSALKNGTTSWPSVELLATRPK